MLHEKLPPLSVARAPLHVTDEAPESVSEIVPDAVNADELSTSPSDGDPTLNAGGVLSIFRVTLVVAEFPPVSVTVPLMICPVPSVEIVCVPGQVATDRPPALHVNVTVTLVLFQPAGLAAGETEAVIVGGGMTAKLIALLASPCTVTTTFPVVAPLGTGTAMLVVLQLVGAPAVPLNVTMLVPCVEPKFVPVMVTKVPTAPDVRLRLVMLGVDSTVKLAPFVLTPLAFTMTFPVVAPLGTIATMLVLLQLITVAVVPLNFTVPLP